MRYALFFLLVFTLGPASASAACDASSVKELRAVFTVANGLHDALSNPVGSVDAAQFEELRARLDDYDAQRTLPCAGVAAELLAKLPDPVLGQTLLRLATRPALLETDSLPRSLARFFAARPAEFQVALASLPTGERCALAGFLESGWPALRAEVPADRAAAGDEAAAKLKHGNCVAAEAKPATEAESAAEAKPDAKATPNKPARDRSMREPRASRPRWA